jgi:hypothetical protein
MQPVDTFEHAGIECAIYQMDDAGNPYDEYDCASRLLVLPEHARNYRSGELAPRADEYRTTAHGARYLRVVEGYPVVIPFRYDDYGSGGAVVGATTDDDERASGYLVVDRETVIREWGEEKTATADAERCARAELAQFAQWVAGDVYGFIVADGTPEESSCWGFYGHDGMTEQPDAYDAWTEARAMAEHAARERARREWWTRVYLLDPTPGPMPV